MIDINFAEVVLQETENLLLKTNKQIDDFINSLDDLSDIDNE